MTSELRGRQRFSVKGNMRRFSLSFERKANENKFVEQQVSPTTTAIHVAMTMEEKYLFTLSLKDTVKAEPRIFNYYEMLLRNCFVRNV